MDAFISWFVGSYHWLVVIGDTLAVLGAAYGAYSLLNKRFQFDALTQGLFFAVVGGIVIALGLGIAALILVCTVLTLTYLLNGSLMISQALQVIFAFSLAGFIFGTVFGFVIGFWLSRLQTSSSLSKKNTLSWLVPPLLMFIFSTFIESLIVSALAHYNMVDITTYINIPLLFGCVFGFIYTLGINIDRRPYLIRLFTVLILIGLFGFLIQFSMVAYSIKELLEFVFGFLITSVINYQINNQIRSAKDVANSLGSTKPSWLSCFQKAEVFRAI